MTTTITYSGPRWAKVKQYLDQILLVYNVTIQTAITKGWLTESGVIKITGDDSQVVKAIHAMKRSFNDYNP